jgi:hypothetical protein
MSFPVNIAEKGTRYRGHNGAPPEQGGTAGRPERATACRTRRLPDAPPAEPPPAEPPPA